MGNIYIYIYDTFFFFRNKKKFILRKQVLIILSFKLFFSFINSLLYIIDLRNVFFSVLINSSFKFIITDSIS